MNPVYFAKLRLDMACGFHYCIVGPNDDESFGQGEKVSVLLFCSYFMLTSLYPVNQFKLQSNEAERSSTPCGLPRHGESWDGHLRRCFGR